MNVLNRDFSCRLICSDTMARGMDIENVQCVVCYESAPYLKTYIHRVGRTARAGKAGTAFSLLEKGEVRILLNFTSKINLNLHI